MCPAARIYIDDPSKSNVTPTTARCNDGIHCNDKRRPERHRIKAHGENPARPELQPGEVVTVSRVIDGNTIEVTSANGRKVKVRLAAEARRDARPKVQAKKHRIVLAAVIAASKKASAALVKLVEGKQVRLVEA